MKTNIVFVFLFLSLCTFSCQKRAAIENIDLVPEVSEKDLAFANVYKILDGTCNGVFNIYKDTSLVKIETIDLQNISIASLQKEGISLNSSINVEQIYKSESPYFQTVNITDTYPESGQQIRSRGVNKIQNGVMWCVVKKPEETIIHEGSTIGDNTIIWQSD